LQFHLISTLTSNLFPGSLRIPSSGSAATGMVPPLLGFFFHLRLELDLLRDGGRMRAAAPDASTASAAAACKLPARLGRLDKHAAEVAVAPSGAHSPARTVEWRCAPAVIVRTRGAWARAPLGEIAAPGRRPLNEDSDGEPFSKTRNRKLKRLRITQLF
jgi:hypothetical protein